MINMALEGSDKSQLWMRPLVTEEDKTMLWEKYGRLNTQYRVKYQYPRLDKIYYIDSLFSVLKV